MKKMYMKKIIFACVLLIFGVFIACGKNEESKIYTITLTTDYGKAMEDVDVRIYTDVDKTDIVAAGKTNEDGKFSFQTTNAEGNVIFFEGDFTGYKVQEHYEIKEENTDIILTTQLLSVDSLEGVTFQLGDVFADISVVTPDGTQYLLSDLLKKKKAVVLNFWYLNCQPCKLEFPYLQEAYEEYKDVLEVLAVNPMDGTDKTISDFQAENGLTFPMAACDGEWTGYMGDIAFPTTVVIDRYGIVSFIHTGSITEKETFTKVFAFFTSDDYEHTTIKRLSELE